MNKQYSQLVITFVLALILMALMLMGCTALSVATETPKVVTAMDQPTVQPTKQPANAPTTSTSIPSPIPTIVSTAMTTPTPEPTPTETLHPLPLSPLFTAPSIFEVSWSPDDRMLAYWSFVAEDSNCDGCGHPPGVLSLHFYDVQTQLVCDYPIPGYYGLDPVPVFAWAEDGQIMVRGEDEITRISTPCKDDFSVVSESESERLLNFEAFSPNGTYRAQVESQGDNVAGGANFTLTLTELTTGQIMNVVTWHDDAIRYQGVLGIDGQWISANLFLVAKSENLGPLLIPVGGEPILVAQDLFDLPEPCFGPSCETPLGAATVMDAETNTYHILLFGIYYGQSNLPNARLYHSESGKVEELTYPAAWFPRFSPDGRWVLLRDHPQSSTFWTRKIDPSGSEPFQFSQHEWTGWGHNGWSPDGTKVFTPGKSVALLSFPEGTQLGVWLMEPYQAGVYSWSRNERFVAVVGVINHHTLTTTFGLFIIPIPDNR